jgi:hypothetical protein
VSFVLPENLANAARPKMIANAILIPSSICVGFGAFSVYLVADAKVVHPGGQQKVGTSEVLVEMSAIRRGIIGTGLFDRPDGDANADADS